MTNSTAIMFFENARGSYSENLKTHREAPVSEFTLGICSVLQPKKLQTPIEVTGLLKTYILELETTAIKVLQHTTNSAAKNGFSVGQYL